MHALLVKGEIKPIAIPGRLRAPKFSDVQTTMEQGFTDDAFGVIGFLTLSAPAATPKEIVRKMSDLWLAAADSEPGWRMMESNGLSQKPIPMSRQWPNTKG
jgi:tripartite-type tricarboxylate transporter receptor subunit TctC